MQGPCKANKGRHTLRARRTAWGLIPSDRFNAADSLSIRPTTRQFAYNRLRGVDIAGRQLATNASAAPVIIKLAAQQSKPKIS
jgi:hypothetical protein